MNEQQRCRLRAAVNEINAAMADIKAADGDGVKVMPWVQFNDDTGISLVNVEISTGRERFGPDE